MAPSPMREFLFPFNVEDHIEPGLEDSDWWNQGQAIMFKILHIFLDFFSSIKYLTLRFTRRSSTKVNGIIRCVKIVSNVTNFLHPYVIRLNKISIVTLKCISNVQVDSIRLWLSLGLLKHVFFSFF